MAKRAGRLFERVADYENLRLAYAKALRGKRDKPETVAFARNFDRHLKTLGEQLRDGTVRVGEYHQFTIYDPKKRVITAPCFRERVMHHAIINVCEPVFENWLIEDTFACRQGRGRLAAINRAQHFARRNGFFLKMDIHKYFDSISHPVLLAKLCRRFKEPQLLMLFEKIIGSYECGAARGLPIGALTSQHFANFFLGFLDRFVKHQLRVQGYVRYMDDFLLWGSDASGLREAERTINKYLWDELRLTPKPNTYINRITHGVDFLGLRVFPQRLILNRRSRIRFAKKLTAYESAFEAGAMGERELQRRVGALTAFVRTRGVDSFQLRRHVLKSRAVGGHRPRTG